jgi:hypothetical protein
MNSTNDNAELRGQPSGEATNVINPSGSPTARAWRRLGAL